MMKQRTNCGICLQTETVLTQSQIIIIRNDDDDALMYFFRAWHTDINAADGMLVCDQKLNHCNEKIMTMMMMKIAKMMTNHQGGRIELQCALLLYRRNRCNESS